MRFELLIALRYLFARQGMAFISVISWISVAGVALGVASLIVVMGVINGFTTDLRDKIIGMTSHAVIYSYHGKITEDPELLERIAAAPGITAATPFISSEVLLSSLSGGTGVYLRGIDPASAPQVLKGLQGMTSGNVEALTDTNGLPGIIIGKNLARKLAVHNGSRINAMSPSGEQSSAGFSPRIRPFRMVGEFSTGLSDYDGALAFVSLDSARHILGWQEPLISGIEVAVDDVEKADVIVNRLLAGMPEQPFYAETWMQVNGNLFAALKLEKAAMAVILTLVVLVGSFSIITALVMLVMEKTRDIAILMSMGATHAMIKRIFITQGLIIGLMGTAIGFALGLGASVLLQHYKFIELPPGVYSLDYLPVLLDWADISMTGLCAMLLCFLATLYPAHKAASLEPADALRHE